MTNSSIVKTALSFSQHHQSEKMGTGTAACRTTVIIKHRDTLGDYRILPEGIIVVVYDEAGNTYKAPIDKSGFSRHENVRCGEISWQLMKSNLVATSKENYDKSGIKRHLSQADESFSFDKSDGYLLIQANDVKTKDPRKQFAEPLKVFVSYGSDGIANVEAIYLPPPMLLNLRVNQKINHAEQNRNKERIKQQLFANGKNVTLFIHGFNVELGKTGHFPTPKELGLTPCYDALPLSSELVQTPYLYYGDIIGETINKRLQAQTNALYTKNYVELLKGTKGNINGQSVLMGTKAPYTHLDNAFHGEHALSWFPSVEYFLNLAASGKRSPSEPFSDWENYTRILGVTWSGNISPAWVFFRAELYANEAGRELAKFIQELDNDIKINIITHSLGARVALSALNVLGSLDEEYKDRIDNLIMLEAAVADNAITKLYTRDKNPIAMELFPFAHQAVKSIQVMYSLEDGVLGADSHFDFDDAVSDITRGTYPLKYSIVANKNKAMSDYYPNNPNQRNTIAHQKINANVHHAIQRQCLDNMGKNNSQLNKLCEYMVEQKPFHPTVIKQKITELIEQEIAQVNANWKTELNLLRPWSHFRHFPKEADFTQHIIDVLMQVIFKPGWGLSSEELEIRPALGYIGEKLTAPDPKEEIDRELTKKYPIDKFISEFKNKQFFFWDQSEYFTTHSAIKDSIWEEMVRTEKQRKTLKETNFYQIYQKTYTDKIIDEYIKGNSKFGRY